MGRQRQFDSDEPKVSVLLSEELYLQIEQFMARRKLKNMSQALRELIEKGLEAEHQRHQGTAHVASPGSDTAEGQGRVLRIGLTPELHDCCECRSRSAAP